MALTSLVIPERAEAVLDLDLDLEPVVAKDKLRVVVLDWHLQRVVVVHIHQLSQPQALLVVGLTVKGWLHLLVLRPAAAPSVSRSVQTRVGASSATHSRPLRSDLDLHAS